MKKLIECPYCDGHAILQTETKEITFRKENFAVREHYYKCESCNEEFTTTDVDTITILQLFNQYREKYNIPFPEEIKSLRNRYELKAAKMTKVLGLGINSYSNYEKGEMPTLSNAKLISMAERPTVFMHLVEEAKEHFPPSVFKKIKKRIEAIIGDSEKFDPFSCAINFYKTPSKYTGYKIPDIDKIIGLITVFLNSCKEEYNDKLKLNKLLFYADFCNYKRHGHSITGISYRAIPYGPVPAFYDNIFALLISDNHIIPRFVNDNEGGAKEIFTATGDFDKSIFTEQELETIEDVIKTFKDHSTWEMVKLSHKERAWQELKDENKIISYQDYAFDLEGM